MGRSEEPRLFPGLRRFVCLVRTAGRSGCMQPRVSFKFEIRQQQCCIVCIQVQFRANKMTHDLNTAFLCYASRVLLSCCTVEVTHRHKSRLHRHSPSSRIRIVLLDIEEEGIRNVSRSMYRARCRRLSALVQHIPLRCAACLSVSSLCLSGVRRHVDCRRFSAWINHRLSGAQPGFCTGGGFPRERGTWG